LAAEFDGLQVIGGEGRFRGGFGGCVHGDSTWG
jgi:hypothetical protein